jgi:hypothetical protein
MRTMIGDPLHTFGLTYSSEWDKSWKARRKQFQWFTEFPDLFDSSDLEIAVSQPSAHIGEWSAAIEFHRRGFGVLIEKYTLQRQHPRAYQRASQVLGEKQMWLLAGNSGLAPDLLVYNDEIRFFVEVKRGADALKDSQRTLFGQLRLLYGMPWFLGNVRVSAEAIGLSALDLRAMIEAAGDQTRRGSGASPRIFDPSDLRQLPIGTMREIRCHVASDDHPRHAATPHTKTGSRIWRCESCSTIKTHETKAEIIAEIQQLKQAASAAGLNNRLEDRERRRTATPEVREKSREWQRLSKDHIDLNWVV